ncbi:N-acetyl-gamma-glutamyl-phosphate reductase [Oricola thermophila]|uniref:N-acetyl-gamma-glutamyl-phosphate reductase n=1 Tax=Oricola thermophila TaxID=2742145 RepID=A0A6N1VH37_9HYPH|nr:N-acetyl-gamma-glutamyl-phosphate reductase [Oricola thermophila]QKV18317.1 N-acetyl-gamma-glutamyl-phosphate reductase [Oricola thermophila]
MKPKIYIDGEHGTTGLQIRQRLAGRDDIELLSIPEAERRNQSMRQELLREADFAILCLPDDASRESVAMIGDAGTRVIDASTAFRTAEGWTYGMAELDREQAGRIATAQFVANPGCWPQGPIATLRPLVNAGLVPADFPVTFTGITGYSGGGKAMIADYEAMGEDAPEYLPYGLTLSHKHLPELRKYAGLARDPLMVPVVGDFAQGMVTMVPLQLGLLDTVPTGKQLHEAIADHYAALDHCVIEVAPYEKLERVPELQPEALNGTDGMKLYVFANDDRAQAVLIAVYDNLGKGASGAAVQNLDIMLGA